MKKNKLRILFVILSIFTFTALVQAKQEEYLKYNWSIKQGASANDLYFDDTMEVEDGYITISLGEGYYSVMRKISKDGKEIMWENINDDGLYLALYNDENYNYALSYGVSSTNHGEIELCRITANGILEKCLKIDSDRTIYDGEMFVNNNKIYVFVFGKIEATGNYGASKVFTITSTKEEFTLEKTENYEDLTEDDLNEMTGYRTLLLSEDWEEIFPEEHNALIISNQFNDDEYMYLVGDVVQDGKTYGFILKMDVDQNVIWYKKAQENTHYFDITSSSSNYIAVVAYKDDVEIGYPRDPDKVESYIYVYNKEGEIVETHDIAQEIGVERADITNILPFENCIIAQVFAYDEEGVFSSYVVKYTVDYLVKTKIEGKGNIEVVEKAYSGDAITFKVTPEPGYAIESIQVTDAYGQVLGVKNNTFTMTSSDVTIEVKFVANVKNPETANLSTIGIIIAFLIGTITFLIAKKKIKWLK